MVFACINYAYDTEIVAKYIEDIQCFDVYYCFHEWDRIFFFVTCAKHEWKYKRNPVLRVKYIPHSDTFWFLKISL